MIRSEDCVDVEQFIVSEHNASSIMKPRLTPTGLVLLLFVVAAAGSTLHHRVARVIGGKVIDSAARWPWLVSLTGVIPRYRFCGIPISSVVVTCSGSLIGARWVMTAAHCVKNEKLGLWSQVPLYWTARMGDIKRTADLSTDIRDFFAEALNVDNIKDWDITADRIFIHPDYDPKKTWLHDLALIRLTRDAPVTKYSQGVPYIHQVVLNNGANPFFPPDGASCVFKGWGCKEFGGELEDVARQVELVKINDGQCARKWNLNMVSRICAGDDNTGICQGDSGGPLVCRLGSEWVQVGVASFTSRAAGRPGVFVSVGYHYSWIQSVLAHN